MTETLRCACCGTTVAWDQGMCPGCTPDVEGRMRQLSDRFSASVSIELTPKGTWLVIAGNAMAGGRTVDEALRWLGA